MSIDISTDYARYPTFAPLPAELRGQADAIRCRGCGSTRFLLHHDGGLPTCAQCGLEMIPEKPAEILHLNRPEKPQLQIAQTRDAVYILRPDGTVRTIDLKNFSTGTAFEGRKILSISGDGEHIAALRTDGTVAVIGNGSLPQCQVQDWTDIVAIASNTHHTVGLRSDGTIAVSGDGSYGFDQMKDWSGITSAAVSDWHAVGLRSDGTAAVLGYDSDGQCRVENWKDIQAISVSREHTVGLCSNGTVRAVGSNEFGQCDVGSWDGVASIYAMEFCTIGLCADGRVLATGKADMTALSAEDRRLAELLLRDKRIMMNWRGVEELAVDGGFVAARHTDGTFSYIIPDYVSRVKNILSKTKLDRAMKKVLK